MSRRRVYDDPNPFGPDFKRGREKPKEDDGKQIKKFKKHFVSLDAYSRHIQLINNYKLYYPGSTEQLVRDSSKDKGVSDIIKENHRFLWDNEDLNDVSKSWDMQLAKRYYDKLFKEYCIADLTHFEKNKVGMRWRTEAEVVRGKGQFECGSKHCGIKKKLTTWEVNFSYIEHGEMKNALVKLRLCKGCSLKLNYHSTKRKIKKEAKADKKSKKHKKKRKRTHSSSSSSSENSDVEPSTSKELEPTVQVKQEPTDEGEKADKEAEASEIWSKPVELPEKEDQPLNEIDQFLEDLFV